MFPVIQGRTPCNSALQPLLLGALIFRFHFWWQPRDPPKVQESPAFVPVFSRRRDAENFRSIILHKVEFYWDASFSKGFVSLCQILYFLKPYLTETLEVTDHTT